METGEEGASCKPQSLGDDDVSSVTGRNESEELQSHELHCQLDLDEAPRDETPLPVSGVDGGEKVVKEAGESASVDGALVQIDVSEKDRVLCDVAEAREVVTLQDSEAGGGVDKQEVKVGDLCDSAAVGTEMGDVAGGCVDNRAREIEDFHDKEHMRETAISNRVEGNMVATVAGGNALQSFVIEPLGSVDKVAEEKDLGDAVTGLQRVAEEEVNLDLTSSSYEIKSSLSEHVGSVDTVGKVAEEKYLDQAVEAVPHVAEGVNLDGTANKHAIESSLSGHVGLMDMVGLVAEEKCLDETVVAVPHVAEERISLDGTQTRCEIESSVSRDVSSMDMVGMVAEEKDVNETVVKVPQIVEDKMNFYETAMKHEIGSAVSVRTSGMVDEQKDHDAAVVEVPHVAQGEGGDGGTTLRKNKEMIEVENESGKDDEMVKADETPIDTGAGAADNVSDTNETGQMDIESGKVDVTMQADDTAMVKEEEEESDMVGAAVQVNEEVNMMRFVDVQMEMEGRGVDMAVEKNDNLANMEDIKEVKDEPDRNEVLEKASEMDVRSTEIESAEQENMVGMENAQAREDPDGSCMVEETMKGEDAEVAYEADDMDEEADAADALEEAVDVEETEPTEESEEQKSSASGKRKRGKNLKASGRGPSKKKMEEDVCFICFDGGELVLCDRRGCPKAYHPSCVNRDEAFFRTKGRWNCGWHLCSNCEKNAYYMCYTCTFSLCKGCIKDAVILCVRGNKGFCETCMRTVMLIEQKEQGNKDMQGHVNFDDKNSWEYLFKDYWMDLKSRLSLTHDELAQAKNPWKGSEPPTTKESPCEPYNVNKDRGSDSDSSWENIELKSSKRRKPKKRLKSRTKDGDSQSTVTGTDFEGPSDGIFEWASKELLEFVMHMRNGDRSVLSQFDVQALLLEYIKRNKLRDPRRKSQIICDARLQNLFGKPRVGHFEMLKLLESHFLLKEDSQAEDLQESVVDMETSQLEGDHNFEITKGAKDKKRKTRKKGDDRGLQSNLDDYAAIDTHNINLIYLKRKLAEDLIENAETFNDKVVGSFVRIRISAGGQKQDLYRLVQVIGTCKATESYKLGKMMTDTLLEILNLNKKEVISIDIISNQEFTEDECKRLRQSIKCGLINRLTVGDVREKAMALQEVRVKDWLEAEILRVSHLRDRASDMGRRKELRECVEKLQMLKTPEERQRRLEEIPEIHADPNMDPSYESEEDEVRQENMKPRGSGFSRRGREANSPQRSGAPHSDSWNGTRNHSSASRELNRNLSGKGFLKDASDMTSTSDMGHDGPWKHGRDTVRESQLSNSWEKQKLSSSAEINSRNNKPAVASGPFSSVTEVSAMRPSTAGAQLSPKVNETEKIWHYKDPSGKVQGPFSMVQLRKWSNTGYFPADLRIWKATEKQDNSILLTDALAGKSQKEPSLLLKNRMLHDSHQSSSYSGKPIQDVEAQAAERSQFLQSGSWNSPGRPSFDSRSSNDGYSRLVAKPASLAVEVPKGSTNELVNLPSPTPQSTPGGPMAQAFENKWVSSSGYSSGSSLGTNALTGVGDGVLAHAAVNTESAVQGSGNASLSSLPTAPVSSSFLANTLNPAVLQNLVQSMSSYNTQAETKGWGSPLVSKPDMAASVRGGESKAWVNAPPRRIEQNNAAVTPAQWTDTSSGQNSTFNTGTTAGNYSAASFAGMNSTETWRQPASVTQSNAQPPGAVNPQWGVGVSVGNNQSGVPRPISENQNMAWGVMQGNPNMGWAGQVPANTNMNWLPGQLPASGNVNPGWAAAPMQGSSAVGTMPGRVGPAQGQPQMGANPGWVAPGQGPPLANTSSGWNAPTTNPNMWGGEQSHNGNRYTNTGDRVPLGGESGYSGSQPWNRQSSFNGGGGGGGPLRPAFKGQRVCKYHESGHCKKGASCDYFHT